jgi:hypothetical protein
MILFISKTLSVAHSSFMNVCIIHNVMHSTHSTYHMCCKMDCSTYIIIISVDLFLCSLTLEVHSQKTGNTAPSPLPCQCHLHRFWKSLDVVLARGVHSCAQIWQCLCCTEVCTVTLHVLLFAVQRCALCYFTWCCFCRAFLLYTE